MADSLRPAASTSHSFELWTSGEPPTRSFHPSRLERSAPIGSHSPAPQCGPNTLYHSIHDPSGTGLPMTERPGCLEPSEIPARAPPAAAKRADVCKGGFRGGGGVGSPPFPKWFPPPFFEEIIPMKLYVIIRLKECVLSIFIYNIAIQNTDFGVLQKSEMLGVSKALGWPTLHLLVPLPLYPRLFGSPPPPHIKRILDPPLPSSHSPTRVSRVLIPDGPGG